LVSINASRHGALVKLIMRKASVHWTGRRQRDAAVVSTESGVLQHARFASAIPFKNDSAIDPVELIAAALAGSFTLALSNELGQGKAVSGNIATTATVTMEHLPAGWMIMNIHLNVMARLPRVTQAQFIDSIVRAKTNCLISRLLRANTSMNARLEK
jgi:lipoyl-dependent peroxiredoxin